MKPADDLTLQPRWRFNYRFDAVNTSLPYHSSNAWRPNGLQNTSPSTLRVRQLNPCHIAPLQHLLAHNFETPSPQVAFQIAEQPPCSATHLKPSAQPLHAYHPTLAPLIYPSGSLQMSAPNESETLVQCRKKCDLITHEKKVEVEKEDDFNAKRLNELIDEKKQGCTATEQLLKKHRVILPNGIISTSNNIYIEFRPKPDGSARQDHLTLSLTDVLQNYDLYEQLCRHFIHENTNLRSLLSEYSRRENEKDQDERNKIDLQSSVIGKKKLLNQNTSLLDTVSSFTRTKSLQAPRQPSKLTKPGGSAAEKAKLSNTQRSYFMIKNTSKGNQDQPSETCPAPKEHEKSRFKTLVSC